SAFTPYVGGGLGVAYTEFDVVYGPGVALGDSSNDFSLQLIAGSSYDLGNGTSLFGDLRYVRDFGTEIDRLAPTGALTGTVEDDIDTVQLNLGVRFAF
ncbi:MAG: outer membrane beta-barrel protein, partial [Pseudomonadota bacterium]